jgi:proliferating cell nuclear antigen
MATELILKESASFKCVFYDPDQFIKTLRAVAVLVKEIDISVTPEGLKMRTMDPAHVAMVDHVLARTNFEEITASNSVFRINLEQAIKAWPKFSKKQSRDTRCTCTLDEETHELIVRFDGPAGASELTLPTMDPDSTEALPLPKINFEVYVRLTASVLHQAIDQTVRISDTVRLSADKEKVTLESGAECSKSQITLTSGDQIAELKNSSTLEPRTTYNINYLKRITAALKVIADCVVIEWSKNTPLKIWVYDGKDSNFPEGLTFMLAPRIESDTDN